ncbi:hypothetical protein [Bacillus cereus group sp. N21]|uniref:hypothetical protein n=1 Tax=Bacillus cereus group sp. N21 TaxID=2794591 RepID=UPI0018F43B4D|nr:hypothetical protein [Bacillus cereus group sp. N21]MBJ8031549.1 hypothetical protein [Bacillus cereus group sp. N21]
MEYIEKAIKDIKENWFENHVAEIQGEEGLQVIYWGKPGTSFYRTKYVLSGYNVFVSGDLGEAVYNLTCSATLENIKGFNLGYFTGKLTAFCEERWNFDQEKAKKELDEFWEENEMNETEDGQEIYDGICSAINESSSMESFHFWLGDVYHNTSLDSDTMEYIWDLGKRLPRRLIGYWLGLQMAIEQLEKNKQAEAVVS